MCGGGTPVGQRAWVPWNSVNSLPPCGFWGSNSGLQVWWQAPLPALPSHLPMAVFYPSSRGVNNFRESLQSRLRHRVIISPPVSILALLMQTVLRRHQLIAPPPSRRSKRLTSLACGWFPGPSVSWEGLVLTAQSPRALDAGARWDFKVLDAQLFTATQRV